MSAMTLARTLATAVCGVWLLGFSPSFAQDAEEPSKRVEPISLVGGELLIINFDDAYENPPKVRINGQEFNFGGGSTTLYKKFRLSDREVLVFDTNLGGSGTPSLYGILAVEFNGALHNYDVVYPITSPWDGIFVIKQKGDTLLFDLGYHKGLKVDAVLSSAGLKVSERRVSRPAYNRNDCRWIYEQALDNCVKNSDDIRPCDDVYHPMSTERGLSSLEENPRWVVAKGRFARACKKACETKKSPPYSAFAKDVCGP